MRYGKRYLAEVRAIHVSEKEKITNQIQSSMHIVKGLLLFIGCTGLVFHIQHSQVCSYPQGENSLTVMTGVIMYIFGV